jgi:hypothetical protein
MKQKILLFSSVVMGLLIAYIDSRPTWDDTGMTVFALLAGGAIIGLLLQKRPWLFALAFGLWVPLWGVIARHDPRMLIVLIFPFAGVFAGWAIRQVSGKVLHNL